MEETTAGSWQRRGSAVLGLLGGRRRGLEETLAAPPWGLVGGRWGLSRGGRMRRASGSAADGVGSSSAGGAYRVEADVRRSLACLWYIFGTPPKLLHYV